MVSVVVCRKVNQGGAGKSLAPNDFILVQFDVKKMW